jgi:hypothetical protein
LILNGAPSDSWHRISETGADAFARDNDVGHTLMPDRSDQPFGKAILSRRSWCARPVPDAMARNRRVTTMPWSRSRSRIMLRGAISQGNASLI